MSAYLLRRKKPKRHKGKKCTTTPWKAGWERELGILQYDSDDCDSYDDEEKLIGKGQLDKVNGYLLALWKTMSTSMNIDLRRLVGLCYDYAHRCPLDEANTFINKVIRMQGMVGNSKYYDQMEEVCEWYLDLVDVDY